MEALEILKLALMNIEDGFRNQASLKIEEAISELEALQNAKCENCKHCRYTSSKLSHCNFFKLSFPVEIGKCDKWENNK